MDRPARYDAILFDFDGVLIDSEPLHYACWREVLDPLGIRLEWDAYAANGIGVSDRALIDFLAGLAEPPFDAELLYRQHYPLKKSLYRGRALEAPPIAEAVLELVRSLDSYRLAVVSSSDRGEVEPLLERAGIRQCFATLVCGREAARLKPAPDPYLLAAQRLEAQYALAVEDSEAGTASALAAGLEVLTVTSHREMPGQVLARLRTRA